MFSKGFFFRRWGLSQSLHTGILFLINLSFWCSWWCFCCLWCRCLSGTSVAYQWFKELILVLQKEHWKHTHVSNVCQHIQPFITLPYILAKLLTLLLMYQVSYVFVKQEFISTDKRSVQNFKRRPKPRESDKHERSMAIWQNFAFCQSWVNRLFKGHIQLICATSMAKYWHTRSF